MDNAFGFAGGLGQIRTKADLVRYAVEFTVGVTHIGGDVNRNIDLEKAQQLIDFFNKNVSLPDTDTSLSEIPGLVMEFLSSLKDVAKAGECRKEDE